MAPHNMIQSGIFPGLTAIVPDKHALIVEYLSFMHMKCSLETSEKYWEISEK